MKNIDVIFLIEHVDRELDAVTCVMEKLRSKFDIASDVRNYYRDINYSLARYNPKVVVFPFFYGADDDVYPMMYIEGWPDACFVNMGWEQILVKLDVKMKVPRDKITKKRVNHLCWTHQHRDFLADHGVALDCLHLTGSPAMRFYDLPYRDYFEESRQQLACKYGLDSERKWVLFAENYFLAFRSDHDLQLMAKLENADLEYLRQGRSYCDRSLKRLFSWVKDLDDDKDPILILRPRPVTSRVQMVDFMRKSTGTPGKNLRIIKAETAREWILAADHVISSHSTTLIEAALAGKMIHKFAPEPLPEALESEWQRFAPSLTDHGGFLNAMRQTEIVKTGAAVAEWARGRLFPVGDPFDATAEVIAYLYGAAAKKARPSIPDHRPLWTRRIVIEQVRKFVRRKFVRRPTDGFVAGDAAAKVLRWRHVLNSKASPEALCALAGD